MSTNSKLQVKGYLQKVVVLGWIALVFCLVVKLFFSDYFTIVCTLDNFVSFCKYVDSNIWANYLVSVAYCFVSMYFFVLAIMQQRKYERWQLSVLILTVLSGTAIKMWNAQVGIVFDVWQGVFMPMLFLGKRYKEYWKIIVANLLLVAFQLCSMYIKETDFGELYENNMVAIIYGVDVVIMVILHYAYANIARLNREIKNSKGEQL